MKKIMLSFLCVLFSFVVYGQDIYGRIVNQENRPVEYANVVALTSDSLLVFGTISDAQGEFRLSLYKQSLHAVLLKISFIGYEDKYLNCHDGDIGTIQLVPSAVQLNEAKVAVPEFELTSEGLQTNVAGTLLSKVGTANDVLKRLPNIQGRDGNFTVFGKGTPVIYINGKEVRNTTELEACSSEDILSVKVITNPGAKYDNSVKSVIQIRVKRKDGEGLGGRVKSSYKQASRSEFVEQVSLNYRNDKLDLFTTLYYDNVFHKQKQSSIQNIYDKVEQNGNTTILTHTQELYGFAGFNYGFNDNHFIGATYTIDRKPGDGETNINNTVSEQGVAPWNVNYRHDLDMPEGTDHQMSAYYNGKAGNLQIDCNLDYLYSKDMKDQLTTRQAEGNNLTYITTVNCMHNKLLASKLILSYPLKNGQVDVGSEYTYTRRNETFENVEQLLYDTDDRINERNIAVFTRYSIQWKAWMLAAGIRYQFTRSNYYQKEIKVAEQSRTYNKWMPEASLSYSGDKFQTQLSYGIKMTRPFYNMLSSNVQYNDQYTYEGGNPLLQPSVFHNLSLEVMYKWVYFAAGYIHKKHEILNIDKPYNDNAVLFTNANFDKIQEVNAMLSLSPHWGFWEPVYSVSVSKQYLDSKALKVKEELEKPIFLFKLNNSFSLPQDWTLGIDYSCNTDGHSGTAMLKHSNSLDLHVEKFFFKKRLLFSLQINDLLKKSYNSFIYYGSLMSMNIRNYSDSRNFQISLTYRFNYARSKYKGSGAGNDEKMRL